MMVRIIFSILLLGGILYPSHSQVASSIAKFSLLTCAPGDMAQDAWGHSAIRFYDPVNQIDEVYNYGTYDFNKSNFILNFLKGKLDYDLATGSYSNFLRVYEYYERSVWEQDFDLNNEQVKRLYKFLQNNALPENKTYQYDFFYDNCSTRIRNMLSDNLSGFEHNGELKTKITFRQLLDVDLEYRDWTDFGIDLILGATCDVQANFDQTMFLPNFLSSNLENATFEKAGGKAKLLPIKNLILDHEVRGDQRKKSWPITPILLFSILAFLELFILLFRNKLSSTFLKVYDYIWVLILSICSIIMMLMWFATEHVTCEQNWNLLWANPGYIAMLFLYWKSNSKVKYYLLGFIIACTALSLLGWWVIPQQYHVAFVPIILTMMLKLIRF